MRLHALEAGGVPTAETEVGWAMGEADIGGKVIRKGNDGK
jgi:hypothetical protein